MKELKKARLYWRRGQPIGPIVGDASAARFWGHVDRKADDECWEWSAARDRYGYGMFKLGQHRRFTAHRLAYALAVGEPGDGHVLHECDNPACCNPKHLFLGTPQINADDKVRKGRARGRFSD